MIEHTQRKHARLSASRADRFMACPGSVALESQMPYEPAGEAAAIGTHIHELSEMLLNGTHTYEEIRSSGVELEHLDMAQDYANFINTLVENPRKRLIEVNVDEGLKSLHPSLGGTADAVLTESRTLHVIDLKTGRIPVSAKDNKQLLVYALGAARKLGAPADITVKMHIFQPRTGHSVAEISGNDLISFGHELKAAAELANTPGAPVIPGSSQCQWCRAKPICSAIREKVTNAAREVFNVNNDVTPAMIEDAKLAETWAGSVLDAAKKQLTDKPESISGWYMKTGRKSKFWRDEALVWEALKGNDQAFELKSPAAILKAKIDISEDMIGEKIGASILTKSKSEE